MIIGHAPAGYITAHLLRGKFTRRNIPTTSLVVAGVVGALMPDVDMLYFHIVDNRQHHHHTYVTHYPIVWLSLLAISIIWLNLSKTSKNAGLAFIFCLTGFCHMILDTIVSDVWWFAPFVDKPFVMFTVPALYKPWWLNFILHWSFALEIGLWVWAFFIYRKRQH